MASATRVTGALLAASDLAIRPVKTSNDFPFYNGRPSPLSVAQWLFLMASVCAGFAALYIPLQSFSAPWSELFLAILFAVVPLLALRLVAGSAWLGLFKRLEPRDVVFAVGVVLLNIAVTLAVGLLVSKRFHVSANPIIGVLENEAGAERVVRWLSSIPQLLGEEVFTLLPFLASLTLLTKTLNFHGLRPWLRLECSRR